MREQVPRESYRVGDRSRRTASTSIATRAARRSSCRAPTRACSRSCSSRRSPRSTRRSSASRLGAREPGARAKIAVSSRDRDVDPVGACVGMKGSRVQAVVQELRGEKIDIVPYDDDPARFVCNAIAPAEVSRVIIDAEGHRMELIVPDDKLSLAIGKKGQNVRLASQLTGWRIDIHSESKIYELERRAKEQIALPSRARASRARRRHPVQARLALGQRAVARRDRGARRVCPASAAPTARARSSTPRGRTSPAAAAVATTRRKETERRVEPVGRPAAHGARRRRRGRADGARDREHPLARGPHQDADRVDRDDHRHRHGRSRAAPAACDQLAAPRSRPEPALTADARASGAARSCRAGESRPRSAVDEGRGSCVDRAASAPGSWRLCPSARRVRDALRGSPAVCVAP